jgi:hypothetical protein
MRTGLAANAVDRRKTLFLPSKAKVRERVNEAAAAAVGEA